MKTHGSVLGLMFRVKEQVFTSLFFPCRFKDVGTTKKLLLCRQHWEPVSSSPEGAGSQGHTYTKAVALE